MSGHTVSRDLDVSAEQLLCERGDEYVVDRVITAVHGAGGWLCTCGDGPFEDQAAAEAHLEATQ